jgi:serine/threonine-protein kinase RsbW
VEAPDPNRPELSGVLPNRLGAFQSHALEVERFLEQHGVAQRAAYHVQLAFEELVTNVIKYAFDDDRDHAISYALRVADDRVSLSLEDDGRPFDPVSSPLPPLAANLEEAEVGGLGLRVLRKAATSFRYRREAGVNHVEIQFSSS